MVTALNSQLTLADLRVFPECTLITTVPCKIYSGIVGFFTYLKVCVLIPTWLSAWFDHGAFNTAA